MGMYQIDSGNSPWTFTNDQMRRVNMTMVGRAGQICAWLISYVKYNISNVMIKT
jgi:hypothetical protein